MLGGKSYVGFQEKLQAPSERIITIRRGLEFYSSNGLRALVRGPIKALKVQKLAYQ